MAVAAGLNRLREGMMLTVTRSEDSSAAAGTLARGLDIIEHVAEAGEVTVAGLCQQLRLSKSAGYRIVALLRDRGYLAETGDNRVRLGPLAIRVGLQALEGLDLFKVTPPHLTKIVEQTQETTFVAVPEGDQMVYVMQEVGPQVVKVSSKLGSVAPLHASGLGKAYLSALPEERAAAVIERLDLVGWTPTTITSRDALLTALRRDRKRGYAIDDAEREPGVRCIAAPIRDASGTPIAALSVAGPADRIKAAQQSIIDAVCTTTARISAELGYLEGAS